MNIPYMQYIGFLADLHDELPPARHPPLRHQTVDRLLLLLCLLDLYQPTDGVDALLPARRPALQPPLARLSLPSTI